MEIREAILKAADWIEKHPKQFSFSRVLIPHDRNCGTPGCVLGWIGHFAGIPGEMFKPNFHTAHDVAIELGLPISGEDSKSNNAANEFYSRMDSLNPAWEWRNSAKKCAETMRLYADKYHPAELKLPSGAEICRAIILKPYKETEAA